MAMTAALGRMEEFRLHASSQAADRRHRRRDRRAAVPDRRVLRRAGGDRGASRHQRRAGRTGCGVVTPPSAATVGFVGLGNMGGVLAANLVATGHTRRRVRRRRARIEFPPERAAGDERRRRRDAGRRRRVQPPRRRRVGAGRARDRCRRPNGASPTWSTRPRSACRPHSRSPPRSRERGDRVRRRAGVRRGGRGPGPHARGDVRGRRRCLCGASSPCSRD